MRALSVRQPWANQIIYTGKDIENRPKHTKMRGFIAIHASQLIGEGFSRHHTRRNLNSLTKAELIDHFGSLKLYLPEDAKRNIMRGAIIGIANLTDSIDSHQSPHWDGESIAWVLENALPLTNPIFCKGQLGFWTISDDDEKKIRLQLKNKVDFNDFM